MWLGGRTIGFWEILVMKWGFEVISRSFFVANVMKEGYERDTQRERKGLENEEEK